MADARELDWDGLVNGRDLGGLPAAGGAIRPGALVRSANVAWLSADGWRALREHGVRTVIDLTEPGEGGPDRAPRPPGLTTRRLPLEDRSDTAFWEVWSGTLEATPLYYRPFLRRYPERVRAVVQAVAEAAPGGVLVHCGGGRDRAGLAVLVLLALVGVPAAEIAADHARSHEPLRRFALAQGRADDAPAIRRVLAAHGTTAEQAIADTIAEDLPALLGIDRAVRTALHDRLVG